MLTIEHLPSTVDHYALSCGTASVSVVHASKVSGCVEHCTFTAQCISALEIARLLSPASRIPVESSCIACH